MCIIMWSYVSKGAHGMKNNVFDLTFDSKAGGITSLAFVGDPYQMNFCKPDKAYGRLHGYFAEEYKKTDN